MFWTVSVQDQVEACVFLYANAEDKLHEDVKNTLVLLIKKLKECTRNDVRGCKERCQEASQLLKNVPKKQLHTLETKYLLPLVQLLISIQWETLNISTACRKLDQVMQQLSEVNHSLVFEEVQKWLDIVVERDQMLSMKGLQTVCLILEDSSVCREVMKKSCTSLLCNLDEVFSIILEQEDLRNGEMCYLVVKVCLQMFQLLPAEVAPLVWKKQSVDSALQNILKGLMSVILGESSNRDARLLAGTAVTMLINTSPEAQDGAAAAWSVLQVTHAEPWQLCIGELRTRCRPRMQDHIDKLALSRGLVTCCRRHILVSGLDSKETCLLLDGLFPIVSALCEEKLDCYYYVFQVFSMWLKCLKECLGQIWDVRDAPLLLENSDLCHQLTQIIWNNAESPVEGVSEFEHSSFRLLLEIYELECQHFMDTEKPLYLALLGRITSLPWGAKIKYFTLCALLQYVGTSVVLERFPELPCHLLKCLSTNHLSPCASEVYKSLIQQQRRELCGGLNQGAPLSELELAEEWAQRWQVTLLDALTSNVTQLQNGASSYLLPWTLRTFPAAFEVLLAALTPISPGCLRAWSYIMSAWRAVSGSWPLETGSSLETLHLALSSVDDSVRLAGFRLVCCSPKTNQAPTQTELSTMKHFLPLSLNSESSPFRQHLQAGVKKFLVRIRDSCLACLRRQKGGTLEDPGQGIKTELPLDQGVDFVDWLAQLPFAYLSPGHCYQRKKTALLLLSTVLETCTDTWSPNRKKGQPPVDITALISFARNREQWDFFSHSKLMVLIGCLEDTTNEIRELSAALLVTYFPLHLPHDLTPVLHERARKLLRSPRVQDAQRGALIAQIVFQKSENLWMVLQSEPHGGWVNLQGVRTEVMVRHLLQELELHYLTAQTDMLLAARTKPIHGVLSALQKCLLDVPGSLDSLQKAAVSQSVMAEILTLLEKISLFLLGVLYGELAGCPEEQDAPPSFCAMGNAICSVIAQSEGQIGGEGADSVLLTQEHSLVLTCCWVSFKEIGIFLGCLVERLFMGPDPAGASMATEDLMRMSKIFSNILLKCRHWGAVEGCCIGFTKFCTALLSHSKPELREIPTRMLEKGLLVLQSPRNTSVTRRAAGLPMLILCIVAAEETSKARPLLALCMKTLLDVASSPMPDSWDQTLDLPQVCAIHTLQALVRGSVLGTAMLHFASAITILSLTLLSSSCWAMRNAALQLYSALCSRMLGQRPEAEESSSPHGMSPAAFFTHYPALQPFLLRELQRAAKEPPGEARLRLHPSLFPVLTLLAKLQPGFHDEMGCQSAFLTPLLQLAASSIYNVRVMASKALATMTPPPEYVKTLLQLAGELPGPGDPCSHNRLHGQLLQMKALLARILNTFSADRDAICDVVELFESKLWLVTSGQRCPLIRSSYLSVASLLARFCSPGFLDKLQTELQLQLCSPSQGHLMGSAAFHEKAVRFICEEAVRLGSSEWVGPMWQNLPAESADVQLSLVKWAAESQSWRGTSMHQVLGDSLQANLKVTLLKGSVEYKRTYLVALEAVMTPSVACQARDCPPLLGPTSGECLELLLVNLEGREYGPELLSRALVAVSLLLPHSYELPLAERWCRLLEVHRVPENTETLRLACAKGLWRTGAPLISRTVRDNTGDQALSISLISTGIYLLQDENQEVRTEASLFVSTLENVLRGRSEKHGLQRLVNQGLLFLLNLLLEEFWDYPDTPKALLCHLPGFDLSEVLRDAQDTEGFSLYEQDEANVFAEPAVMSEYLLPSLLQLVERSTRSSSLGEGLACWARENAANVLENVSLCRRLRPGEALALSWLDLLVEPGFQMAVCGLFVRALFLLRLLETSEDLRPLCDPMALREDLHSAHRLLSCNGVLLPSVISLAIDGTK